MRITWVTRSFLDYRIPLYQEINRLCGHELTVIYYKDVVPQRCQEKLKAILNNRAIGLSGELRVLGKKNQPVSSIEKKGIRIPYQPGLIKVIKKTKPEILLSDGFFQWTYAALWYRLWYKIPHLMLYEGTKHTEKNSGKLRTLYRKTASKLIDGISCNGVLSAEYIERLGFSKSRIFIGNMAADVQNLKKNVSNFDIQKRKQLKQILGLNENVFLVIGRLVTLKGVDKLLKAWSETFGNKSSASLLIVGDGPERTSLELQCTRNSIENVCFTGSVDYDSIYQYFSVSNIFVIATLQDNWSLVVPEAMSCGLPIITSKYNGCWPELVKPENGWVFDPLDKDNFITTLKNAWENRNQWKEMGENSLQIVEDYTPEKVAMSIFEACNIIVKEKTK